MKEKQQLELDYPCRNLRIRYNLFRMSEVSDFSWLRKGDYAKEEYG